MTGRVGEKLLKTDVHYRSQNGEVFFFQNINKNEIFLGEF